MINQIINSILYSIGRDFDSVGGIIAMLLVIFVMSAYEFIVYRIVSHRSMYNKSFHISIMILPFFIAAIVAALQSNLVITLGTIGALAIIRFRTAVKDPVDMMYLLWSVYIGIACGCKLYESCILTSVMVTLVLVLINLLSAQLLKNPMILVVNADSNKETELGVILKEATKNYRLKSRNFTSNGVDFVYQLETKKASELTSKLEGLSYIKQFSLLEFDNDDVI